MMTSTTSSSSCISANVEVRNTRNWKPRNLLLHQADEEYNYDNLSSPENNDTDPEYVRPASASSTSSRNSTDDTHFNFGQTRNTLLHLRGLCDETPTNNQTPLMSSDNLDEFERSTSGKSRLLLN